MNGIRLAVLVLFLSICRGDEISVVRGTVETESGMVGDTLVVELQTSDHTRPKQQATVASDGVFEFRDTAPGWYVLRLTTLLGAVVSEQTVHVNANTMLTIRLPKQASSEAGAGTPVSARRLAQPVPKKAARAFADAEKASEANKPLKAVEKLEEAIRIFPGYFEARSNLGVQYIRLRRYDEAVAQFDQAIATGPPSALVYGNLCYALLALGRLPESEQAARRAIALDSTSGPAHFLLGNILLQNRQIEEGLVQLRLAARTVPKAHLQIAKVEQATGHRAEAERELRQYLKSENPADRPAVERWLTALRER
jgi:Flp pilus assembly protein TadD